MADSRGGLGAGGLVGCLALTACITGVKLLLVPTYRSTDFEVHRNWLAITHSLPFDKWYTEATSQWTLDYPPFFAWFEYALSHVAQLFDPNMLVVTNLDYASAETILFQRFSVIVTDLVYITAAYALSRHVARQRTPWHGTVLLVLLVANAGLLLVDHIHFQYNGVVMGLLLWSVYFLLEARGWLAAIAYTLVLHMKHLYVWAAPVYLVHLARGWCFSRGMVQGVGRLLLLAATVLGLSAASLGPFIRLGQLQQLLSRLLPFGRGLTHTYWAGNAWALYSAADKLLAWKAGRNDLTGNPGHNSSGHGADVPDEWAALDGTDDHAWVDSASGVVGVARFHVLPQVAPAVSLALVGLCLLPPALSLLWQPHRSRTPTALACMLLAGFWFGYHVHEKAILPVLLMLAIPAVMHRGAAQDWLVLSAAGHYGLLPLLYEAQEYPIKLLLCGCYWLLSAHCLAQLHASGDNATSSGDGSTLAYGDPFASQGGGSVLHSMGGAELYTGTPRGGASGGYLATRRSGDPNKSFHNSGSFAPMNPPEPAATPAYDGAPASTGALQPHDSHNSYMAGGPAHAAMDAPPTSHGFGTGQEQPAAAAPYQPAPPPSLYSYGDAGGTDNRQAGLPNVPTASAAGIRHRGPAGPGPSPSLYAAPPLAPPTNDFSSSPTAQPGAVPQVPSMIPGPSVAMAGSSGSLYSSSYAASTHTGATGGYMWGAPQPVNANKPSGIPAAGAPAAAGMPSSMPAPSMGNMPWGAPPPGPAPNPLAPPAGGPIRPPGVPPMWAPSALPHPSAAPYPQAGSFPAAPSGGASYPPAPPGGPMGSRIPPGPPPAPMPPPPPPPPAFSSYPNSAAAYQPFHSYGGATEPMAPVVAVDSAGGPAGFDGMGRHGGREHEPHEPWSLSYLLGAGQLLPSFLALYILGFVPLEVYCSHLHGLLLPGKLPFLPLLLTSVYCALGVGYVWLRMTLGFLFNLGYCSTRTITADSAGLFKRGS